MSADLMKLVALLEAAIDACHTAEMGLAGQPLAQHLTRCRLVLTRAAGYISNAATVSR